MNPVISVSSLLITSLHSCIGSMQLPFKCILQILVPKRTTSLHSRIPLSFSPPNPSPHPNILSPFLPIRQHNMRFTLYYGWTHYSCPFQKPYPTICSEIRVILPRSLPPFFTPDYSLQTINEVSHYYRWSSEWFG